MKYSTEYEPEKMAKAKGTSLNISFKQSVEICSMIRNKKYSAATKMLQNVQEMKEPVPYRKFNRGGTGHRKGSMGPGRFPVKASKNVLEVLKSAYANADQKGLDTGSLKVCSAVAKKGSKTMKYSRIQGRRTKRTHIEIMLKSSGVSKKSDEEKTKKTEGSFADVKVEPAGKDSQNKNLNDQTEAKKDHSADAETGKQETVNKETPAEGSEKQAEQLKNKEKIPGKERKSEENKK